MKIFTLLDKPCNRVKEATYNVDFSGFIIPDYFVIGYGLDYNEQYRGLKHIVVLNDKGINHGKKENLEKQDTEYGKILPQYKNVQNSNIV